MLGGSGSWPVSPGPPDLNQILTLFPRLQGPPAFDPQRIAENIQKLQTRPAINTGHPFLDLSVPKTALAYIDATFQGDHPKYGVGTYANQVHDGFPPTIIAAVDALSTWGVNRRAGQLFRFWLGRFVKEDGRINYYGPSLSEYGQLLHTVCLAGKRAGPSGWWEESFKPLNRLAEYLLRLRQAALKDGGLIPGVPEADTRKDTARYFHNNAWVAKGLRRWAELCQRRQAAPSTTPTTIGKTLRNPGLGHFRRHPKDLARRSGRLVAVSSGGTAGKAKTPYRIVQRRFLHQLPLLARVAVQRPFT